jgi:hypothetical protein
LDRKRTPTKDKRGRITERRKARVVETDEEPEGEDRERGQRGESAKKPKKKNPNKLPGYVRAKVEGLVKEFPTLFNEQETWSKRATARGESKGLRRFLENVIHEFTVLHLKKGDGKVYPAEVMDILSKNHEQRYESY